MNDPIDRIISTVVEESICPPRQLYNACVDTITKEFETWAAARESLKRLESAEKIQDFLIRSIDAEDDLVWSDDATDLVRWCGRMAKQIVEGTLVVE